MLVRETDPSNKQSNLSGDWQVNVSAQGQTVTIQQWGKPAVKFNFSDSKYDPKIDLDKLKTLYLQFSKLEKLNIFDKPQNVNIVIARYKLSAYEPKQNTLFCNIEKPYYLDGFVHELGHAVFNFLTESKNTHPVWKNIYQYSLGDKRYKAVDDSNFIPNASDDIGHPFDNESELFASSFRAYVLNNSSLKNDQSKIGNNINKFLSETMKNRNVFGDQYNITDQEINDSLAAGLLDPAKSFSISRSVGQISIDILKEKGFSDEAIGKLLTDKLSTVPDPLVRLDVLTDLTLDSETLFNFLIEQFHKNKDPVLRERIVILFSIFSVKDSGSYKSASNFLNSIKSDRQLKGIASMTLDNIEAKIYLQNR